jgi:F0F1-type ATP synthase membrane subunit c/vacuolar-type H+-ATPase subunit K
MAVIVVLLLLCSRAAQAQLLFDLNPASQAGNPGTSVTFSATLTNAGLDTVWLNGTSSTGLAPGLTLDPTPFFNDFPFFLISGDAATADIFTVAIDNTVAPGNYFGSFSILGGADPNAEDLLATQNFQVTVVPETSSLFLLVCGLLACGLVRWRMWKSNSLLGDGSGKDR